MSESRCLPKNICQMGGADPRLRVYVEDYVHVFLKNLARGSAASLGVLLGECGSREGEPYVFVRGALLLEGAVSPGGEVCLAEDVRTSVKGSAAACFPGEAVVGWFLNGDAVEGADWEQCRRWKRQLMPDRETLLCMNQVEERSFYRMAGEDCLPLQGYYLYYEKNPHMKSYAQTHILSKKAEIPREEQTARMVRQVIREQREEKRRSSGRLAYGLCALLTVFLAVSGMWIVHGRRSQDWSGETEAQVDASAVEPEGPEIHEVVGGVEPTTVEPTTGTEEETPEETTEEVPKETVTETPEETVAPTTEGSEPVHYTVKPGQGLAAIAREHYGYADKALLEELCRVNGLSDPDHLTVGQKIMLP